MRWLQLRFDFDSTVIYNGRSTAYKTSQGHIDVKATDPLAAFIYLGLSSAAQTQFGLGTGVECHPCLGQPSCQFSCFCDRLFDIKLCKHASDWRHDLITLTFDLSVSKWGHGSHVSWASLLQIFSLLCLSILVLGSGTEQTDGQPTTVINALFPHSVGA